MDSANNETNEEYFLINIWLTQFASVWPLNSIYLFVILPLGLIGFFLNILCFYILKHNDFEKISIYGYFKVITINSALLCLFQSTVFISQTHRYFHFSNTNEANLYATLVYLPVSNVILIFGSILDICISLERCSIFYTKFKVLIKQKVNLVCLILFIVSILIGLPYFFINWPEDVDFDIGKNKFFKLWYWDITTFGRSLAGQILTYGNFFIRDVLFLSVELGLNIFSIALLRNYFINKAKLVGNSNQLSHQIPLKSNIDTNSTDTQNVAALSNSVCTINVTHTKNLSAQEKNLTIMIIIMCFFSIIIHIFYLIVGVFLFFSDSLLTSSTGAFVVFTSILKHMSNIIFLFLFNVKFRKRFKKTFAFC